ncbi:protein bric-a-brac 1-like isoform X2 [Galleria mellonella]|uniref:Protein bric-a-brac 1-like isoform X2 n=1 Tax=Galleria mellonella TaxID=7137 RepID=A0ABM3MNC0_GALME|nr:protein bric-a-brac 1-like isoform X2 [Galleria mellonella]
MDNGRRVTRSSKTSKKQRIDITMLRSTKTVKKSKKHPVTCEPVAAREMPAEEEPAAMESRDVDGSPQQFCLRWNNYQSNLANCFDQLLQTESFVDVTLACEGQSLKAHKVVLSACSPYFQALFMDNPCQHPIIIMRDIKYCDLKAVVDFMYRGEINVSQDQITALLKVAETLKIRGLTDVGEHAVLRPGAGPAGLDPRAPKRPVSRDSESSAKARRHVSTERDRSPVPGPSPRRSPSTPPSAPAELPPAGAVPGEPGGHVGPSLAGLHADDVDIRPGIAEMIREEERVKICLLIRILRSARKFLQEDQAKLLENSHAWLGASTSSIADSYQYQLQSMWQKCWNTNQSLVHNLRFRERGPLKSWRPETMAEAIFSVLKEGLSLSQAARKYDIPYPTFVLYANRVHNMLGPSADGGADLRPKGRGRPQRILLGVWPDEHIRGVIRAVVFRDTHTPHAAHHIKEEVLPVYPSITDGMAVQNAYGTVACGNGREGGVSPNAAAAAAVAAVAHGLRRQMCNMVVAAQRPPDHPPHLGLPPLPLQSPRLPSPLSAGLESPLCSPPPPGHALEPPKPADPFRPFASPRPDSRYGERDVVAEITDMGPPKTPVSLAKNGKELSSPVPVKMEPPVVETRAENM